MYLLRGTSAFAVYFAMLSISAQAQETTAPTTVAESATTLETSANTPAVPVNIAPVVAAPIAAFVAPPPVLILPANTEVIVTPDTEANSKTLREGHIVALHAVFDVMHNGVIVIPKGTSGSGTVTWRTGKGAFGKSAKMEITFKELTLPNDHRLPLSGMHRQEGEGNTGAAIGAAIAVGVFGAFVTGKSAIVPTGQHLIARTNETLAYTVPAGTAVIPTAQLAPAIDDAGAASAATTTPSEDAAIAAEPVATAAPTKG